MTVNRRGARRQMPVPDGALPPRMPIVQSIARAIDFAQWSGLARIFGAAAFPLYSIGRLM